MILAGFIFALIMSFFLSGAESALVAVSRVRVRHAAEKKDPAAQKLLPLLQERDSLLGTVTVMNHVMNVAAFGLIVWQLVKWIGFWGYGVSFLLALPLFVIGLEVVPKTLFRRYPFRTLRKMVWLLQFLGFLARPFAAVRRRWMRSQAPSHADQLADLLHLIRSMVEERLMPSATAHLMERILKLRGHTVRSLLRPLAKEQCISEDMPMQVARLISKDVAHHMLVLRNADGRFTSLLDVSRADSLLPEDRLARQYARPIEWLDPSMSAIAALQRLRRRGQSCALVRLEQEGTGIVTEEDLLAPLLPQGGV
jgi:CBS domain containing-hemolysin-like protein